MYTMYICQDVFRFQKAKNITTRDISTSQIFKQTTNVYHYLLTYV